MEIKKHSNENIKVGVVKSINQLDRTALIYTDWVTNGHINNKLIPGCNVYISHPDTVNIDKIRQETINEIQAECEKAKQRAIGWNITFLNGFERCLNVINGMK